MKKIILWLLIIANLIGAYFGFTWWYGNQLLNTPWYLWIFVPDCPLYALFFSIALSVILLKKKIKNKLLLLFFFITTIGLMKYGLWTVFTQLHVFVNFKDYVLSNFSIFIMVYLIVSHAIMFLESFLILGKTMMKNYFIPIIIIWFLINDYFDYFSTTLTTLPKEASILPYMVVAISSSVILPFLAYYLYKKG